MWSVYTLEAAPTGGPSRSKKEATTVSAYSSCRGAFTRMMHVTLLVVVRWWFNFFSTLLLSFFHAENISGQPKLKGKSRGFFWQNSSYIWAAPLITTGSDDPSLLVRHPIPLVYPPPLPTVTK